MFEIAADLVEILKNNQCLDDEGYYTRSTSFTSASNSVDRLCEKLAKAGIRKNLIIPTNKNFAFTYGWFMNSYYLYVHPYSNNVVEINI